jgi:hypothetical protein
MTTYRLTRWIPLSGELGLLKYRRALTAMSVGRMTMQQLGAATGLRQTDLALLLRRLKSAEALDIEPAGKTPTPGRPEMPQRCDIDLPMELALLQEGSAGRCSPLPQDLPSCGRPRPARSQAAR